MKKTMLILIAASMLCSCSVPFNKNDANTLPTETPPAAQSAAPSDTPAPTAAIPVDYNDIPSKGYGWGFVRQKGAPPQISIEEQERLVKYNSYYLGEQNEKNIYLTFDEGYENGFTSAILDVLKDNDVKAAFFVTMPYLEGQQPLVSRMIDEGHTVGNHTVHHPNLSNCTVEEIQSELDGLNQKSIELYGYEMKYMRPPEGAYSERALAVARDMGYKTIFWSHAYKDWDVNLQKGADYAANQVLPYLHSGEILLLHAVSKDNAEALDGIIKQIKEQGYTFRTLDELP